VDTPFEEILSRLQRVELPLAKSLAAFEEGVRLARLGQKQLADAEHRVEQLLGEGDDGVKTAPLDEGDR
jgi:exodeoxyribonuclease VII small subunit